jgi:Domain of unknown function (DUF4926)
MIRELDCVELTADLPEFGLHQGDIGAVVLVHLDGESFEVEFVRTSGETQAVATLKSGQIRRIEIQSAPVEESDSHVPFRA